MELLKKSLFVVLATVTVSLAQPFTISGTVSSSVSIGLGSNAQFRIVFKGLGTLPSDSVIATFTGTNFPYAYNFSTTWSGTVHIHRITPGFTFQPDSFPLDRMNPSNPRVTHNFLATDNLGPVIDSIKIAPKVLNLGDTVTLSYRTIDNMCNNASKLIEISYNNGPWEYVDSTFESYTSPTGGIYKNYFIYATSGDWRSKKTQKFVSTKYGIAKFRITVGDFTKNKMAVVTETFNILPVVSILKNKQDRIFQGQKNNSLIFDLSGRKISINKTSAYLIQGTQVKRLHLK